MTLVKKITRVQIARYAAATNDFNPLHLDDEHARRAGMPGVIAHGLLSLGFAGQAVTEWCGGDPSRVRRLSMRFRAPVQPGDELIVEVVQRGESDGGRLELELTVRLVNSEILVASGSATVAE